MPNTEPSAQSEILLYQTEDGRTRIQCRLEGDTLWLTQAQMAELFQTTVPNINLHLKAIYAEAELSQEATIKSHLIVRAEGIRRVSRPVLHYSLPAVLAVGFRVRSHRGAQFRQWATTRLNEYLVKGFTLDDERLKNPPGPGQKDYFDELLERIRDIRASERRFYQKVLDIYATSVDYTPDATQSQLFFATVQNKMPALSDRRNILVIADETHRSQYDLINGLARNLRDALPNASFIGFTGTPIEKTDANTRAVFGDYISIYDIQRAVADKATVPIYYESRIAKLGLNASELLPTRKATARAIPLTTPSRPSQLFQQLCSDVLVFQWVA